MSAGLNAAQLEAVNHVHGPSLVLAGAGSGKTRVITHKIAHLMDGGMSPSRIAAITFTNKAAAEMRERAKQLAGKRAAEVLICTFHALGVRMLRQQGSYVGLKEQFSILDSDDVTKIMKDCGGSTDNATARQWQWAISAWKNQGLNSEQALAIAANEEERACAVIMARYEERLAAYQSVDFDDLISLPLKLLREHDAVRQHWQQQLGHVLVDEYQDTNATQYELLKLLVGERGRLTAVGDDDQSIYGWRGADVSKILGFERSFPGAKVVKLETNYRSTAQILGAANRVIKNNPNRHDKALRSALGDGEPLMAVTMRDESVEAEKVVAEIKHLVSQGHAYSDFAILFRTAVQPRPFEAELRMKEVPYVLVGGMSFFDRKEVRDVLAYLRVVANPRDEASLLRIVNSPPRGVGKTTLDRVLDGLDPPHRGISGALDASIDEHRDLRGGPRRVECRAEIVHPPLPVAAFMRARRRSVMSKASDE